MLESQAKQGRARRWPLVLASSLLLGALAAPFAVAAGDGKSVLGGKRNPAGSSGFSKETQIVSRNGTYSTRQSNITNNDGGGAIYGCRSQPGREPCIRANNLNNGRAFEFNAVNGTQVGAITVGNGTTVSPTAVPFVTNAGGRVTNLNADKLDGLDAEQVRSPWAIVGAGGGLGRNNAAVTSANTGTGEYQVTFNKDVSACSYQATLGQDNTADPPSGEIGVARGSGPNNVKVVTRDSDGTRNNKEFHVSVDC